MPQHVDSYAEKMRRAGMSERVVACFRQYYLQYRHGTLSTEIREEDILPPNAAHMAAWDSLPPVADAAAALAPVVMIKLNGGLGTSMGLSRAKSLLPVKGGLTFLDVIARQALATGVRLLFMNSFATREDTLAHLAAYPELRRDGLPLDFVQHQFPRLRVDTGEPLSLGDDRDWNPPGHGDIYLALQNDRLLDRLIGSGSRYAFISNSDNLGALPDARIAAYMARDRVPFLLEVCQRGPMDRKGGHLAMRRRDGQLVLREAAQRPRDGHDRFEDIETYCWFNTNNLWVDLAVLRETLARHGGFLPLPLIRNPKMVAGVAVVQLETAMGAAVEVFAGAHALVVSRERFVPVKKTGDLLVVRSDAYELDEGSGLIRHSPGACLPLVDLDDAHYGRIDQLDAHFPDGAPSLRDCVSLRVSGPVSFLGGVTLRGAVTVAASQAAMLSPGVYTGTVTLPA